jgi:hypothetical protein
VNTTDRPRIALWVVLSIVAVVPIFVVPLAPLYDYHNWVYQGRIVADLLHAGPDAYDSVQRDYALNVRPIPNLAAPVGIGFLTTVMPSDAAGRVFLALCVLFFAYAYAYLVRTMQGRATAMEFFGFPWAFGYFYYKGYISYLVSLPLAFIAIAKLHRIYSRPSPEPTFGELATLAGLGALLYLSHLLGWLVFGIALGVYGVLLIQRGYRRSALKLAASVVPSVLMLAGYVIMRLHQHDTGEEFYRHVILSTDKIISMVEPFMLFLRADPFTPIVPVFLLNLVALVLLATVAAINIDRRRLPDRPAILTAVALGGCALVLPFANFGELIRPDERFVLPALLIGAAGLPWKEFALHRGAGLAVVIVLILGQHLVEDVHASRLSLHISDATAAVVPPDATVLSLTIHEGPTHGGCTGGAGPSIGAPTLRWLDLRRLVRTPTRRADLLDTSLVRAKDVDPAKPRLVVQTSSVDGIQSQPGLGAQYQQLYPYIEVFGCQHAVDVVSSLLAGAYRPVVAGDNFAVLVGLNRAP